MTEGKATQSDLVSHQAFTKLIKEPQKGLSSVIALGLYHESAARWFESYDPRPTRAKVQDWHSNACRDHEIARIGDQADQLLRDFSRELVAKHHATVLDHYEEAFKSATDLALRSAIHAADTTKKSFARGVAEAFVGAFAWTIALILFDWILKRAGIDLLHIIAANRAG